MWYVNFQHVINCKLLYRNIIKAPHHQARVCHCRQLQHFLRNAAAPQWHHHGGQGGHSPGELTCRSSTLLLAHDHRHCSVLLMQLLTCQQSKSKTHYHTVLFLTLVVCLTVTFVTTSKWLKIRTCGFHHMVQLQFRFLAANNNNNN